MDSGTDGNESQEQQREEKEQDNTANDLLDTATNLFNILLAGVYLLVVGISVWIRKTVS